MSIRTDLAVEKNEMLGNEVTDGVSQSRKSTEKTEVTVIEITNENGEKTLEKPIGKYITVELSEFSHETELTDDRFKSLVKEIKSLLPESGLVLVAGLGNESITPDAIGPKTLKRIFATRHIDDISNEMGLPKLREVAGITPGVLGQTGMETAEIIKGVADKIKPAAIITVDALASSSEHRLGKTVQLTDTGITPGSGVGNSRAEISQKTLGVPVIAVGVPTVIDASTLAHNLGKNENEIPKEIQPMMVTPREIDVIIDRASKLVALAINLALQPEFTAKDILAIV